MKSWTPNWLSAETHSTCMTVHVPVGVDGGSAEAAGTGAEG